MPQAKLMELKCSDGSGSSSSRRLRLLRRCLCCLALFDSEWVGERICQRCKHSARWRTGVDDTPR
jgi:hypothetical protein